MIPGVILWAEIGWRCRMRNITQARISLLPVSGMYSKTWDWGFDV
jgi:hypothetical protein